MGHQYKPNTSYKDLPSVISKKQLIQLFETIDETDIFVAALIALFCGLRISEVCNLKKQDVDLDSGKLKVNEGKGSKDRYVMIPEKLKPVLERWFRANSDAVFVIPKRGDPETGIQNGYVSAKFRGYLQKAGLLFETKKDSRGNPRHLFSFHSLRHTYATYLHDKGLDVYTIQKALGHSDVHTTQIYAYISTESMKNKIDSAFGKVKSHERNYKESNVTDPVELLKLRFANGEITASELEERHNTLKKYGALF